MKKNIILILCSLFFISSGCYTYYPARDVPDSLKVEHNEYIKIQKFYLNNGDSVDVSNFDVKYYDKYKKYEKVFVCIQLPANEENQVFYVKTKKEEKIIPSDQIKSVIIEKRKTDTVGTILAVISIVILSVIALIYLILVIMGLSGNNIRIG